MIEVIIFINDIEYGFTRQWPTVPRVGDWLQVGVEKTRTVQVEQVIWCGEEDLSVRLYCKLP